MLALTLLWIGSIGVTAELRDIEVARDEDRYRLVSEAWFAASPEDMYRVLSDYDLFEQFTSAFVEARNIEPDEQGRPRFFARMEGCVLLFCKSFVRRGHLELEPPSEIVAVVDPAVSDFKHSHERWRLVRDGDGTLLVYTFEMEPGFWVPPVIGPYVIMRTLRDEGRDAIDRIEALAQGREPKR